MKPQFMQPTMPEFKEKYTKAWFKEKGYNLKEARAGMSSDFEFNPVYGSDLISNLGTQESTDHFMTNSHRAISKMFSFSAAHFLPQHEGLCQYLHGHEWRLEVCILGAVNDAGMVMDYSDLSKAVKSTVIAEFDHAFLNAIIINPTAENILVYIWQMLQIEAGLSNIYQISLWETPTSRASISANDMSIYMEGFWND